MNGAALAKLLDAYGVKGHVLLPVQKGYRNASYPVQLTNGQQCNFILYKNELDIVQRIRRANAVGDFVAAQGLPCRSTADPRIMQLRQGAIVRYGALYGYLPGQTIPWEAYTHRHLRLLGKTMSDIHACLQYFTGADLPSVTDEYISIMRRMQHYFTNVNVQRALTQKLQIQVAGAMVPKFITLLRICTQLSGQQPLHMDFVRGNILFNGQGSDPVISGILDFEKTAHGHPLFDIARTLAFLLVDCKYKSEAQVRKSFLQSGYARRGKAPLRLLTLQMRDEKTEVLESLVHLFLLYDFYKFLRHNPYEYLLENEHFVRTRDILLQRGLLTATTHRI